MVRDKVLSLVGFLLPIVTGIAVALVILSSCKAY
jgi:hypothetical protein